MVKKSIIAMALMCVFATVSFGQDYDFPEGQFKIDGIWPGTVSFEYSKVEICRIPVKIKIGMFIEIDRCKDKKIIMEQINCSNANNFPCYKGCVRLKVRANFLAQISLKGFVDSDIINGNKWKAYFLDPADPSTELQTFNIDDTGNWNEVDLCFEAWDANIFNGTPGSEEEIGAVAIYAIPLTLPDCDDWDDWCP